MLLMARKISTGLVGIVIVTSLAGCAAETLRTLYLKTVPEGAVISADDGTPSPRTTRMVIEYYTSSLKSSRVNGCAPLGPFTATWPSGAKASTGVIRWCNLDEFNLYVNIERPKDSPNLEVDRQAGKDWVAQDIAETEQVRKRMQEKYEYERLNPPPPPETSSDDDDIGMAGAITAIAGAYVATRSSSNHSTNNPVIPAAMTSILTQSQQSNSQQYMAENQDQNYESERPQSNAGNSRSGEGSFDYDSSHTQCVTYKKHPTLEDYAQYKNTCPYAVSVTYCSVFKNGRDNCANRIFGSFELKAGGTNIAEGSDVSVSYIACKLPFRSLGSEVKVSGGKLTAPCQKNK